MPEFELTLVIDVNRGRWRTRFDKPEHALNSGQYTITKDRNRTALWVSWPDESPRQPQRLEFRANQPIAGIGFAESSDEVRSHHRAGRSCGAGGFRLLNDLDGKTTMKALVENPGYRRTNGAGYHFGLWLGPKGDRIEIDPQIYNEGVIHDPDGEPKRGFLRLLLRFPRWLWRLLTGWLR